VQLLSHELPEDHFDAYKECMKAWVSS
jgi:hypothetical protein